MEFPQHKWVRVRVGHGTILGFAYVDPIAGPSIKGRMIRKVSTPDQVRRAVDEPNSTIRVVPQLVLDVLEEDEVRDLELPQIPAWYSAVFLEDG